MTQLEITEVIRARSQAKLRADTDLDYRAEVLHICATNPDRFVSDWCWTSDPRNAARGISVTVPFVLYPRQVEYLQWRRECLANRQFGVHAKSRDSGASWLNCADHIHHWIFTPEFKGGFGSNKEIRVDRKGDPDALFYKLRFLLQTLPAWMKPKHVLDKYMLLQNIDNGSIITGDAGLSIGRGGRSLLFDWDEASFTENQETVLAALSESTDCCIRTSTPNGSDDPFARDYQSGNFPTFSFHWKQDPRKNQWTAPSGEAGSGAIAPDGAVYPWYEKKRKALPAITLAREIDISFEGSIEGVVIKHEWVLAAINYPLVMSNDRRVAGLDPAGVGKDRTTFIIVDGGNKCVLVDAWQGLRSPESARKAADLCHGHTVADLNFDVSGLGDGVAGTLQSMPNLRFKYHPINGGSSPTNFYWAAEKRTSKDKFYNLRAEIYYRAAERFRKTFENVKGIDKHHNDECISIPNDPRLISQLSLTTGKYADNGKLLLTSKSKMNTSPDYADALVYALFQPLSQTGYRATKAVW